MDLGRTQLRIQYWVSRAWQSHPALDADQWRQLELHYALLRRWNPKVNLVSASTLDAAATKHYAESLFLAAGLPEGIRTVVDVGSGAGFPGFPLAVMCPGVKVVLIESDKRKAAFLRESCGLANLSVANVRMEDWAGTCDATITRAVDPKTVLSWARQRAQHFGCVASMTDIALLAEDQVIVDKKATPFPWLAKSGILWTTFHVKRP